MNKKSHPHNHNTTCEHDSNQHHQHDHSKGSKHSDAHGHGHSHSHGHSHGHGANKNALKLSFFLIAGYMIIEFIGGLLTNSLALLSDAGHMLSDAGALGLSYLAMTWGQRQASKSKTFGYKRFEVLAAFINGLALALISIYIFWEAFERLSDPPGVMTSGMLTIAVLGLLVNVAAAFILMRGDTSENLNIRSAFLHVLGDLLGSVGAIVAALLIMFFGWNLADPIASILVAILVIISAYRVTRDSIHILMEGTPLNMNTDQIKQSLLDLEHVVEVHDLHVWALSSDVPLLSCHIIIQDPIYSSVVMEQAQRLLNEQYEIKHITIQMDRPGFQCHIEHH
ncbi:cation diffusion facilitator family transporter [Paenibacillus sp. 1-18]|uniref:cation diffusion facilitator family transporter n=1 Tax=Paenibacillus sp. 1-18 TaxID=1333846 RepID=UPI000471A65F|nr:cation diffusion facilitator family transporter [Paenibacillus sp. 1-18]